MYEFLKVNVDVGALAMPFFTVTTDIPPYADSCWPPPRTQERNRWDSIASPPPKFSQLPIPRLSPSWLMDTIHLAGAGCLRASFSCFTDSMT